MVGVMNMECGLDDHNLLRFLTGRSLRGPLLVWRSISRLMRLGAAWTLVPARVDPICGSIMLVVMGFCQFGRLLGTFSQQVAFKHLELLTQVVDPLAVTETVSRFGQWLAGFDVRTSVGLRFDVVVDSMARTRPFIWFLHT